MSLAQVQIRGISFPHDFEAIFSGVSLNQNVPQSLLSKLNRFLRYRIVTLTLEG